MAFLGRETFIAKTGKVPGKQLVTQMQLVWQHAHSRHSINAIVSLFQIVGVLKGKPKVIEALLRGPALWAPLPLLSPPPHCHFTLLYSTWRWG